MRASVSGMCDVCLNLTKTNTAKVLMQHLAAERDLSGDRDENSGLLERVHLAVRAVPPSDIRSVDRSKVLRAW